MKRMTPAEAAEWRRKSVERYRAKRQKHAQFSKRDLDAIADRLENPVPPNAELREASEKAFRRSTKPVTPQRARKQAEAAAYRRNREMRLVRARGQCEFATDDIRCGRAATQTHHRMRRSHHVDHGVENLRALCAIHHAYIHANVEWAKANGWIRVEWDKIGETPMER